MLPISDDVAASLASAMACIEKPSTTAAVLWSVLAACRPASQTEHVLPLPLRRLSLEHAITPGLRLASTGSGMTWAAAAGERISRSPWLLRLLHNSGDSALQILSASTCWAGLVGTQCWDFLHGGSAEGADKIERELLSAVEGMHLCVRALAPLADAVCQAGVVDRQKNAMGPDGKTGAVPVILLPRMTRLLLCLGRVLALVWAVHSRARGAGHGVSGKGDSRDGASKADGGGAAAETLLELISFSREWVAKLCRRRDEVAEYVAGMMREAARDVEISSGALREAGGLQ